MNDYILDQNSLFCSSLYATHMLEAVKRTKIKEVILQFAPHTGQYILLVQFFFLWVVTWSIWCYFFHVISVSCLDKSDPCDRGIAKAENRNEQDVCDNTAELCWKDRCFSLVQGSREEEEVSLYLCILLHESFFSCSRSWPKMFIGKTRQ